MAIGVFEVFLFGNALLGNGWLRYKWFLEHGTVVAENKYPLTKVWGKKTGHFLCSVAHQISILALKLIKRGPNEMF